MTTMNPLDAIFAQLAPVIAPWLRQIVREAVAETKSAAVEPLVDKRELARLLGVSVPTVDRLDREGQPFLRVGDSKRYELPAVLAWHRERTKTHGGEEA